MVELHITTHGLQEKEIGQFVGFCNQNRFKPILIELEEGDIMQQPMISYLINSTEKNFIHNEIERVTNQFIQGGYSVQRIKIEVPINYSYLAKVLFPDYKGQYGEWHAKLILENEEQLAKLQSDLRFKVSRNRLKGEPLKRYVTYRHYAFLDSFEYNVSSIRNSIKYNGFSIEKEEFEYCIFDSNKSIDRGWIDTPEITDLDYLQLLAFDSIVKRQSLLTNDFVLKGSLVTRQFLSSVEKRIAHDLDFVYIGICDDEPFTIFSKWVEELTTVIIKDYVSFNPFSMNDFWRRREYAMNDDFPTTNTDLTALYKDGTKKTIGLDISWGLDLYGEITEIPYLCLDQTTVNVKVVGLPLQLSWKLHQCLVRPRVKDFIDIIFLLEDNDITPDIMSRTLRYLSLECQRDGFSINRLNYYCSGQVSAWVKKELDEHDDFYETPFGFSFEEDAVSMLFLKRVFPEFTVNSFVELVALFESTLQKYNISI